MFNKRHAILIALILLCTGLVSGLTKSDFFDKEYQYCGVTQCYTQYRIMNPTAQDITVNTSNFRIDQTLTYKGTLREIKIFYLNNTGGWEEFRIGRTFVLRPGVQKSIRVYGKLDPVLVNRTASYSIDHIPRYQNFTFPEFDLWNQTYGHCVDVNITYNLGNFSFLNETFPQRIYLNGTIMNISRVRSDWGDVRFSKGTCANVTSDYLHSFVYRNTTDAQAIFYFAGMDIVNNTPARVALFYNNSGASHVEPLRSDIEWGNGQGQDVRIFTNDMLEDTNLTSNSALNYTNKTTLITVGGADLVNGTTWRKEKKLIGNQTLLYVPLAADGLSDITSLTGFSTVFNVVLYNWNATGTYRLMAIGNSSNILNTNVIEAFLVIS